MVYSLRFPVCAQMFTYVHVACTRGINTFPERHKVNRKGVKHNEEPHETYE